jgi:hypothetical protein
VKRGLAPPLSLLVITHVYLEPILPRGIQIGVFASLPLISLILWLIPDWSVHVVVVLMIIRLMTIMTTAPTAGRVFTDFARGGNNTGKVRLGHGQSVIYNSQNRNIFFTFFRKIFLSWRDFFLDNI